VSNFPLDWNEWRDEWHYWRRGGGLQRLRLTKHATAGKLPGQNFMADEVLGLWSTGLVHVELSEVTFGETRGIGITLAQGKHRWTPERGVVHSFGDLEDVVLAELEKNARAERHHACSACFAAKGQQC
jgi:hypothetical protein